MSREGAIANMMDGKEQEEEAVRRWSGRQKKKHETRPKPSRQDDRMIRSQDHF